jgi:hypothetical protein
VDEGEPARSLPNGIWFSTNLLVRERLSVGETFVTVGVLETVCVDVVPDSPVGIAVSPVSDLGG